MSKSARGENTRASLGELPPLLTVRETAALGRVCLRTVYNQIERGEIKATRIRSAWRVNRDSALSAYGLM